MMLQMFTVGKFLTNCYVINCTETGKAAIIDPGFDELDEAEEIFAFIKENALQPQFIINTHGHPDHTCGNGITKTKFNIPILIHRNDAYMIGQTGRQIAKIFSIQHSSPPPDTLLKDDDTIKLGNTTLKVLATPGHSKGSISLLENSKVFTGDTLFAGSIGRTDFPESSETEMSLSLKKLKSLPDHLIVYPGHGPPTTLSQEKRNNPFL